MEKRKIINVAAAVIERDGRIYATERGYGPFKDFWEFPGGKIEPGESPEEALHREIFEELRVRIRILEGAGDVLYDYPEFRLHMTLFLCNLESGEPTLVEHEAARWVTKEEMKTLSWLPADYEVLDKIGEILEKTEKRDGGDP